MGRSSVNRKGPALSSSQGRVLKKSTIKAQSKGGVSKSISNNASAENNTKHRVHFETDVFENEFDATARRVGVLSKAEDDFVENVAAHDDSEDEDDENDDDADKEKLATANANTMEDGDDGDDEFDADAWQKNYLQNIESSDPRFFSFLKEHGSDLLEQKDDNTDDVSEKENTLGTSEKDSQKGDNSNSSKDPYTSAVRKIQKLARGFNSMKLSKSSKKQQNGGSSSLIFPCEAASSGSDVEALLTESKLLWKEVIELVRGHKNKDHRITILLEALMDTQFLVTVFQFQKIERTLLKVLSGLALGTTVSSIRAQTLLCIWQFVRLSLLDESRMRSSSSDESSSNKRAHEQEDADEGPMKNSEERTKKHLFWLVDRFCELSQNGLKLKAISSWDTMIQWLGTLISCLEGKDSSMISERIVGLCIRRSAMQIRDFLKPISGAKGKNDALEAKCLGMGFVTLVRIQVEAISQMQQKSKRETIRSLTGSVYLATSALIRVACNSLKYTPLVYQLFTCLLTLSQNTGFLIPLGSDLLEYFDRLHMRLASPKKLEGSNCVKNMKPDLSWTTTKLYQTDLSFDVVEEFCCLALDMMAHQLQILAHHPAFPEALMPVAHFLSKYSKNGRTSKIKKLAKQVLESSNETARNVEQMRLALDHTQTVGDSVFVFTETKRLPIVTLSNKIKEERNQKLKDLL